MQILEIDEGRLPQSPRAAAEALMRLTLEICEGIGIGRQDLIDFFNNRAETGDYGRAENVDDAVMRGFAMLSVICAQRMRAPDAPRQEVA